jgi:hypothetical protein
MKAATVFLVVGALPLSDALRIPDAAPMWPVTEPLNPSRGDARGGH